MIKYSRVQLFPLFIISIFIISPLAALFISLLSIQDKSSGFVFVLFGFFFGLAHHFSGNNYLDSMSYASRFLNLYDNSDLKHNISQVFFDFVFVDIYADLVLLIVGFFTNNPKILFSIFGLIFSILQLIYLRIYFKTIKCHDFIFSVSVILLFLCNPIAHVNNVRFWTGCNFMFCFLFSYVVGFIRLRTFIIGLLILPFIHSGFIIFSSYLVICTLLKSNVYSIVRRYSLLIIIFSFILGLYFHKLINLDLSFFGDHVQSKFNTYSSSDYQVAYNSVINIKFRFILFVSKLYINICVVYMTIVLRKSVLQSSDKLIYLYLVLIVVFSNFFIEVPTVGERFNKIAFCFMLFSMFKFRSLFKRDKFLIMFMLLIFFSMVHFIEGFSIMRLVVSKNFYTNTVFINLIELDNYPRVI